MGQHIGPAVAFEGRTPEAPPAPSAAGPKLGFRLMEKAILQLAGGGMETETLQESTTRGSGSWRAKASTSSRSWRAPRSG